MKDQHLKNFIKLLHTRGVGFKFLQRFYKTYGTFGERFEDNLLEFLQRDGSPKRIEEILTFLRSEANFKPIFEFLKLHKVEVIPFFDQRFPKEILELDLPIAALFVMGQISPSGFSIVGTRKASVEGRFKTREFAAELAKSGFCVISGGAEGVDSYAHEGALSVGGKTGVIVGEGLYNFVRRRKKFVERVLGNGGFILSPFPIFTQGAKWTFPLRNSLIAYYGFYGTLVVEAPPKSGALITADYALKLKRPLFTYLNCVRNQSFGGNVKLLKECKARLITEAGELLTLLGEKTGPPLEGEKTISTPSGKEGESDPLEELLREKPKTFDELLVLSNLTEEELLEKLTELELEGKITQEGGFYKWVA